MSRSVELCALLTFVSAVLYLSGATHVEIECFPNGTVTSTNPLPETHFYVSAITDQGDCNATLSHNNTLITIEGCPMNTTILLELNDITYHNMSIIGGANTVTFTLFCQEITSDERNVTLLIQTDLVIDEYHLHNTSFSPRFFIRKGLTQPPASSAVISETIYLTYDLYKTYTMKFHQCTAYQGKIPSIAGDQLQLIVDDCSQDETLIKSFASNQTFVVGDDVRYYTEMKMFRFWRSLYVTIVCDVHICRIGGGANCTMHTCSRRRRSQEVTEAMNPETEHAVVSRTFEVLSDVEFLENQGTLWASGYISSQIVLGLLLALRFQ